jgi:hypothetical protein
MHNLNLLQLKVFADTAVSAGSLPETPASSSEIRIIIGIVFGIIGALSVLFIIIAGVRYMMSGGDPQKTAKAKEGIIYALVGLAVAICAESIVVFFVGQVS